MRFLIKTSHDFFPDTSLNALFQIYSEPVDPGSQSLDIEIELLRHFFMLLNSRLLFVLKILDEKTALLGREIVQTAVQTIEICFFSIFPRFLLD
jgi:hypothetical protein